MSAFLDQPLIPYGHHQDFAEGYGRLTEIVRRLGTFGTIRWGSFDEIMTSNYMTRPEGGRAFRLRLFSRRVRLHVPEGIEEIVVELPLEYPQGGVEHIRTGGREFELERTLQGFESPLIPVEAGATDIAIDRRFSLTDSPRENRMAKRALVRRAATETRDRLQPLAWRSGLAPILRRVESAFHATRERSRQLP